MDSKFNSAMKQRILVTGCHGLLGQKLVEFLDPDFCELHGVDLQKENYFAERKRYHYHCLDITKRSEVIELVRSIKPTWIINTAAMTAVDACEFEKERCWQINVTSVKHLVDAARRFDSRLIQISTDYVFDGEAGPYTELDRVNPISYYGKSKLAAENEIMGGGIDWVIARTVVLFGHGRKLKPSFVHWLVSTLKKGSEVKIVTDQISNVTLVDDFAKAIKKMVAFNKSGVFHISGREVISRFDFAVKVAEFYDLDKSLIKPTITKLLGQPAKRPLQSGFVVDKAQKELDMKFCDVEEALQLYRQEEAKFN